MSNDIFGITLPTNWSGPLRIAQADGQADASDTIPQQGNTVVPPLYGPIDPSRLPFCDSIDHIANLDSLPSVDGLPEAISQAQTECENINNQISGLFSGWSQEVYDTIYGNSDSLLITTEQTLLPEYCGYYLGPQITAITTDPAAVNEDQAVSITITGERFPSDAVVKFEANGVTLIEVSGEQLTVSEDFTTITIPTATFIGIDSDTDVTVSVGSLGTPEIPTANYNTAFTINNAAVVAPEVPEDPEVPVSTYDWVHNRLRVGLVSQFGLSNYSPSDAMPLHLRPIAENVPHALAALNLGDIDDPVTIFGRSEHAIAGNPLEWLEGTAYLNGGISTNLHGDDMDNTRLAAAELGANLRFYLLASLFIDTYANLRLSDNSYLNPNEYNYNGLTRGHSEGIGLGSNLGQDNTRVRLFGEFSYDDIDYDRESFGFNFEAGESEAIQAGLEFETEDAFPWLDISLRGSYTPGWRHLPEYAPALGIDDFYRQSFSRFDLSAQLSSDNLIDNHTLRLSGDYSNHSEDSLDLNRFSVGAGIDGLPFFGRVGIAYSNGNNITLHQYQYPFSIDQQNIILDVAPSALNDAITLILRWDEFSRHNQNSSFSQFGAAIRIEPLRFFIQPEPAPTQEE